MNASMNAASASAPSSIENERRAHEPSMEEILASIRKIIADDDALPLSRPSAPPRLFETNVTQFAPPPTPSIEAAPAPAVESGATNQGAEASLDAPEKARLDASEMESFAEVGRELARLETSGDADIAFGQGDALRPALDAAEAAEPPAQREEPQAVAASFVATQSVAASFGATQFVSAHEDDVAGEPVGERIEGDRVPEPQFGPDHAESRQGERAPVREAEQRPDPGAILSAEANASVASAFQALSASVQMASAEAIDRHVRDMLRPMLKQWLDDNLPVMVERLVRAEIERVARGGR